jgi:hypothetical protein
VRAAHQYEVSASACSAAPCSATAARAGVLRRLVWAYLVGSVVDVGHTCFHPLGSGHVPTDCNRWSQALRRLPCTRVMLGGTLRDCLQLSGLPHRWVSQQMKFGHLAYIGRQRSVAHPCRSAVGSGWGRVTVHRRSPNPCGRPRAKSARCGHLHPASCLKIQKSRGLPACKQVRMSLRPLLNSAATLDSAY